MKAKSRENIVCELYDIRQNVNVPSRFNIKYVCIQWKISYKMCGVHSGSSCMQIKYDAYGDIYRERERAMQRERTNRTQYAFQEKQARG